MGKTVYEYLHDAQNLCETIRSAMLDAMLESYKTEQPISSDDFSELNALAVKLDTLAKRFAPPPAPEFTWDEFCKICETQKKEAE